MLNFTTGRLRPRAAPDEETNVDMLDAADQRYRTCTAQADATRRVEQVDRSETDRYPAKQSTLTPRPARARDSLPPGLLPPLNTDARCQIVNEYASITAKLMKRIRIFHRNQTTSCPPPPYILDPFPFLCFRYNPS